MKRVRAASALYLLLAAHAAIDGMYPLLNDWKAKLWSWPFYISGGLFVAFLLLVVAPVRARPLAFVVACGGALLSAAATMLPLALDGEFASGSYPYPGGQLFAVIQFVCYLAIAVLLRRDLASNKLLQATREDARA